MKDNKIVLFDGTNTDMWRDIDGAPCDWEVRGNCMIVNHKNIVSTVEFGDAQIHVEFRCPDMPEFTGQSKGNSGVYVHGCYEIQVLDSYGIEDYQWDDCGSIYKHHKSLFNATLPALEWQTYDIIVRAPRYNDAGEITECARLTLIHNGVCIHNNIVLESNTDGGVYDHVVPRGPLMLQDHGDKVAYRNIWVRPLD